MLLATITDRAGAPIFGAPARAVRELAGDEVTDLIAAVRRSPPGLKVSAYVEIVGQAVARRQFATVGASSSEPFTPYREAWADEPSLPPEIAAQRIREARDQLRGRADGASMRETATGGGA